MAKGAKLKQDEHFPDYTVGANYGKYKIVALCIRLLCPSTVCVLIKYDVQFTLNSCPLYHFIFYVHDDLL